MLLLGRSQWRRESGDITTVVYLQMAVKVVRVCMFVMMMMLMMKYDVEVKVV